jgi:hypothetical protein
MFQSTIASGMNASGWNKIDEVFGSLVDSIRAAKTGEIAEMHRQPKLARAGNFNFCQSCAQLAAVLRSDTPWTILRRQRNDNAPRETSPIRILNAK